jgi:DNA-binding NarL/FixJ family response regulator
MRGFDSYFCRSNDNVDETGKMIEILIADDHAVVRKGLVQIVSETLDIKVVAEASNGEETLDLVREHDLDVVVLDLNMPGPTGLDVLKQLNAEYPDLPVLILSVHPEDQYALRVLRAGASGYLTKDSAPEKLVGAIRRVAEGGKYLSSAVAEQLLFQIDSDADQPLHAALSDREFQVMRFLAEGMSVTDIAKKLSLGVKTISTYRARLLDKMQMSSNAELARYALEHDLIQ